MDFDYRSGIGTSSKYAPASTLGFTASRGGSAISALICFKPDVRGNQSVRFGESSGISVSLVGAVKRVAGNVRLVVRNKGKRYLSDAINFRTQDMNYFRPLDVLGAEFDPVDKAPLPKIPESGFEVSASDFDNIQAVGRYVDALERNADNGPYFYLKESLVDAEVSK